MDRIARALGLNYAYYPASIHPASGKYFGPAVLSPLADRAKLEAAAPSCRVDSRPAPDRDRRDPAASGETRLLVYAVHLETPVQISEAERRDQVMAVVSDAAGYQGPVVIAGDFNSEGIGGVLRAQGYTWLTEHVGPTVSWFSWDHIFVRGALPADSGQRRRGAGDPWGQRSSPRLDRGDACSIVREPVGWR